MRNQKKLLLEQLDNKLSAFNGTETIQIPDKGWIYNIRTALNMTLEQLGQKLNITKQGAKKIEERESTGAISIKSLSEVAKALDMKFVYGFVSNYSSLEKIVEIKAIDLAKKIVLRTHQNMKLENQGNADAQIKKAIEELSLELKREMPKSLWD
ncbi:MAG: XRE family transcriptional regulator [Bacteroidetes bacterium GWA2_31_9]|nr:MAG: XRE family transcriptional regulator [Bacteroidetes bacterium GWA2_31_9]